MEDIPGNFLVFYAFVVGQCNLQVNYGHCLFWHDKTFVTTLYSDCMKQADVYNGTSQYSTLISTHILYLGKP